VNEAADTPPVAQPAQRFLDKIERERNAEIQRIRAEAREAGGAARRQARRESRLTAQRAVAEARAQAETERLRVISGLQAQLRRAQWLDLQAWVQKGTEEVMGELRAGWADPGRQWEWAGYWLRAALDLAGDQALRVVCDATTDERTLRRIESLLASRAARSEVLRSEGIGAGLRIEWGAYLLDGTLAAQRAEIEGALLARLARLRHESCA
jgi:vacuolar-type H+-ATPase subunit E/Vma4